jgi:simple sugar transport system ATP-binding protein
MFGLEEGKKPGGSSIAIPPSDTVTPAFPSHGADFDVLEPSAQVNAALDIGVLEVRGLSVELPGRPFIRGVDLELSPGKILGIAGVRDSGLETLELAVTGFLRPTRGTVVVNGRDVTGQGPLAFREAGAAYLGAGISGSAPSLSIRDNIILHAHRRSRRGLWGKFTFMNKAYLDTWTTMVLRNARLSRSPQAGMASFSGGMIQRIILARECAEKAALLVLAEPSRGLDQVSRAALLRELGAYAGTGRAILVFSTDIEELAILSDEIRVLRNGTFSARLLQDPRKKREDPVYIGELKARIGRAMAGEDRHG